MDSVMKGLMGQCPRQNFWTRTAPANSRGELLNKFCCSYSFDLCQCMGSKVGVCTPVAQLDLCSWVRDVTTARQTVLTHYRRCCCC